MPPQAQQAMFHQYEPMSNPVAAAIAACPPVTTVTVGIPDNMIGAILGPGGATISELQSMTGARIIVSQRDEFLPGTENRILTISGAPMATQVNNSIVVRRAPGLRAILALFLRFCKLDTCRFTRMPPCLRM